MNRIYRLVFNRQLGVMQVASELASSASSSASVTTPSRPSRLQPLALCVLEALLLGAASSAFAADVVIFNGNDRIDDEIKFQDGFIVGSDQAGALRIVNGGHVTTDRSLVGDQEGSNGTLVVDGPDAWLKFHNSRFQYVSGSLVVGNLGSGTLQVLNGGHTEQSSLGEVVLLAVGKTSDATVLVDGQDSLLQAGYFKMGGAGSGLATVSNGGKIVSTAAISTGIDLAYSAGSHFTLDVLGEGSEVSTSNAIYVGKEGSAALNIRDGAAVRSAGWLYAADEAGSSGDILVNGAGSLLSGGYGLTLALEGDASLRITNGATVALNDNLWTSYGSGSTSTLLVDGSGSSLSTGDGSLLVGRAGASDMIISHGGQVRVGDAMVGTSRGATGSILVDGDGSLLIATGDFQVGDSGKGELTIRNGGQVSAASMKLSDAVISASDKTSGKVTVDGQGSSLTITGEGLLTVGGTGNGTLDIANGGHVTAGSLDIGSVLSGYVPTNALAVSGAGSMLDVKQDLRVGRGTNGRLEISDGAKVVAGNVIQGDGAFRSETFTGGIIEITGEGSQLTASNMDLRSQFTLAGGATVTADTVSFANAPSGADTAVIKGAGTLLTVSDAMTLNGNVDVADGAKASVGSLQAGYDFYNSRGVQLHVTGAESSFTSAGDVMLTSILSQASGTLLLSDGGYFSAGSNTIQVGTGSQLAFGANQLADEARTAGQLDSKTKIQFDGLGVLVLNHTGGALELGNTLSSFGYNASSDFTGSLLSKAGTTKLTGDLHAFNGDLLVEGGKLVLASDMNVLPSDYSIDRGIGKSYQSVDVVGNGTLVIDGSLGYAWGANIGGDNVDMRGTTSLQVYGRAEGEAPVLAGSGNVAGTVYIGDGGVISPGDASAATFTINGDLYFTGNTVDRAGVFAVDVKGDGSSDKLMVTGMADLRENDSDSANPSEVRVTAIDAATSYQDGQQYTILHADGGVQGTFSEATSQSAFLTPSLTYTANDVVLTIALNTSNLPMTVGDGQTLSGNGSYGSTQVLSGGRLSPGTADSRIGTQTFNGDLSFAAGAFYDVDLKGAATTAASAVTIAATSPVNDLVNVTGKASLSGGTVQVTALDPQTSYQDGHTYTILHADGGVAGSFAEVTSKSAFLVPTLSYATNDVVVAIRLTTAGGEAGEGDDDDDGGNSTSPPPPIFETVATSRNQYNIARALDTLPQQGEGLALYDRLLMLDAASARAAFGSLSGEIHTAVRAGLLEDRFLREGVDQRLAGQAATSGHDGIVGWVAGSGTSGRIEGDGNAVRMQGRREGVLAGVDFALGQDSLIGVAGGVEDITRQVKQWQSESDIDANEVGVYAATRFGALQLYGGVDYADYDVRSRRQAVVGAAADTLHGDYDASATTVYAEAGWMFGDQTLSVTPYLNVAHTRLQTDGVTETGGSSALDVSDSKDELLTSTLGARLAWDISGGLGDNAVLTAGLAWQNASGELKADNRARFVVGSDEFRSYGAPLARNVGIAEIGVGVDTGESSRVSLAAQGRAGDGQREFGAQLNWQWRF